VNALTRGMKTIRQVGILPVLQVGLYRFGLITGHYRRLTPPIKLNRKPPETPWLDARLSLADSSLLDFFRQDAELKAACLKEAEFILGGKCHIFGQTPVNLFQTETAYTHHWTEYELKQVSLPVEDIKFIWEPARLGWIFTLCRAQAAGKIPGLGKKTWDLLQRFLQLNPVNCGPNWMNGQEVALRILALVFFHEVFRDCPDMPEDWEKLLAQAVIDHARRIPPTLVYARSQQNNHLLVETAGLYTAGVFLPDHPESRKWRDTGWQVFHQGLDDQIDDDGTYAQYSTNYHRLMLQIALWVKAVALRAGDVFPETSTRKLAAAANWLDGLTAPETGRVPNYGHNDGAYILPLTGQPFEDFRPVLVAARNLFLTGIGLEPEDEMTLWFKWLAGRKVEYTADPANQIPVPSIHSYRKISEGSAEIILFTPQFNRRPGQSDLLQVELRHNGQPVVLDPGTYRYNADPPWDNALAQTRVHNTVSINEEDQMTRAGRFLWLDWPAAQWNKEKKAENLLGASHNGFQRFSLVHEREVAMINEHVWRVFDRIDPEIDKSPAPVDIWIHWLLPPLDWQIGTSSLKYGKNNIERKVLLTPLFKDNHDSVCEYQVIKAGVVLYSSTCREIPAGSIANLGWYSPTYGIKEPAVSYRVLVPKVTRLEFLTEFIVC